MNLYPFKILIFWYTLYDGMTHMYKYMYMSESACACIDFSLLSLNPYIVKTNVCTSKHAYVVIVNEYIVYRIYTNLPGLAGYVVHIRIVNYIYSKVSTGPGRMRAKPIKAGPNSGRIILTEPNYFLIR